MRLRSAATSYAIGLFDATRSKSADFIRHVSTNGNTEPSVAIDRAHGLAVDLVRLHPLHEDAPLGEARARAAR